MFETAYKAQNADVHMHNLKLTRDRVERVRRPYRAVPVSVNAPLMRTCSFDSVESSR